MMIGPLDEWTPTLDARRAWVRGWIADAQVAAQFEVDWNTRLDVVVAVATNLRPEDVNAWQALGVVFGDALSMATGLPWGEITDEYGTDPCLVVDPSSHTVVFPLTMLSKRVEQGAVLDGPSIRSLFEETVTEVRRLTAKDT